ncbi:MAG: hypothetical protein A2Y25_00240 [Candidatus Melainabacteria bacterium GWF2_37_15]|nr:MAG: hypothetical protein A2Y25_00240 [Candidatus Melainabacteria bacterium GWF2_37_15]
MNQIIAKEKLEYYKNFKNNLWTLFIVVSGGNAGLALNLDSTLRKIFLYTGIIIDLAVIAGIFICIMKIRHYIYKLGDQ